jgi:hypothetical protein
MLLLCHWWIFKEKIRFNMFVELLDFWQLLAHWSNTKALKG